MPEVIQLDGSPSELLAAADVGDNDDAEVATQQQDAGAMNDDDDSASAGQEPVRFHEVLSDQDKEERRQLIRKIGRYRALFAKELEDIHTGGLDQMPLDALRDLGRDVEFLVGTRRSAKAVRGMFIGGLQAGEVAGPFLGLDLTGLANVAAASEDLLQTVDEVAIKYESQLYVDPVARLGLAVAQLAFAVDAHNRRKRETVVPSPSQPQDTAGPAVPEETPSKPDINNAAREYDDL
jgi:hypothetical protein